MTQESLHNYNEKLNAAREELNKVNGILNNNPTVAVIRSTTNEANNVKAALDEARTQLVLIDNHLLIILIVRIVLIRLKKRTIKIKLIMQRITES